MGWIPARFDVPRFGLLLVALMACGGGEKNAVTDTAAPANPADTAVPAGFDPSTITPAWSR